MNQSRPQDSRDARDIENSLDSIVDRFLSRRRALQGMLATAATGAVTSRLPAGPTPPWLASSAELPHLYPEHNPAGSRRIAVAEGHLTQIVLRWGDPVTVNAPPFRVTAQSAVAQEQQFGYNNDFVAFMPLPRGSRESGHGLLCVNHEFTLSKLMFPSIDAAGPNDEQMQVEMAAHGVSVVEIRRVNRQGKPFWERVSGSRYNRRLSARSTRTVVSGPAAGHHRLRTKFDPSGRQVMGTLNNCAGGVTPWGTMLTAEENFHFYFRRESAASPEARNHQRYGIGSDTRHNWCEIDDRFDADKHPHEPNRFGWVVEFDPYDPQSVPVKRTALGRLRHEGAATSISPDGRVVVYMGDDSRFEYLYKFVSRRKYNPDEPSANKSILDEGVLYVARFYDNGVVRWHPLIWTSQGPLNPANGFASQADVLIETRRAATLMGATPMDRPEDVEENPATGHVFVMLTNNSERKPTMTDAANPRAANIHGHIIELLIPRVNGKPDHAATQHRWDIFLRAGDSLQSDGWYQGHRPAGWLSCPDNCTFDGEGRLWISTDGAEYAAGFVDGLYCCDTTGPNKALTRQFFRAPTGAELCGPCFTPDYSTLFIAVQHPGDGSTFEQPSTRWPNAMDSAMPPQPAVVAIMREDSGTVG